MAMIPMLGIGYAVRGRLARCFIALKLGTPKLAGYTTQGLRAIVIACRTGGRS